MIPNQFVQDLLARTDIVEIVGAHVTLRKTGANLSGLCPFHNEKSPSFSVSPTKQFYHCFGCGVSGSAIGFLMEYSGYAFTEAVEELARRVGLSVPKESRDQRFTPEQAVQQADHRGQLLAHHALAAQYFKAQLKANARAIDYLKRRGLSGEIAAKFGLGYAPDAWQGLASVAKDYDKATWVDAGLVIDKAIDKSSDRNSDKANDKSFDIDAAPQQKSRRYDRFRDRIMFPIRSTRGEIIGFGGRIIDQGEPKYLNSPETPLFNKGQELYGLAEARVSIRAAGYALVTEGYMDVVALAQLGFAQSVATLGTAVSATHVQKLFRYTEHIVFSFDGDGAGRKAAWRALEESLGLVGDTKRASFLFLPQEHDPDSYVRKEGAQAFEHAIATAVPLSLFLLKTLTDRHDTSQAEGRAALLHAAKPMLQKIRAPMLSLQIIKGLAQAAQIDARQVEVFLEVGRLGGDLGGMQHSGGSQFSQSNKDNVNTRSVPLKAQLDGSVSGARLSKQDWIAQKRGHSLAMNTLARSGAAHSTGAIAPQASRAQLLGLILLQAPEQFAVCEPWIKAWRADLKHATLDEQTLAHLCDELVFVAMSQTQLNETILTRHLAAQSEQGVGSGLSAWLELMMRQTIPPAPGDALRIAAGLREYQLQWHSQQAAITAGESPQAMQTYKHFTQLYLEAKAAARQLAA